MNVTEVIKNVNTMEVEERKLSFLEKLASSIGGLPGTFHYQMMQMFLLFFYTDVMKISAAYVAILFLVIRIFDAILAPVFGAFVDKITTPWGKYKPWFLLLNVPMAFFGWLTFTDFNLSPTSKLVYVAVTYTIYSVLAAISGVPGGAIVPVITKRVDERVSIGQLSFLGIMIGALVVGIAVQPLYKSLGGGNDAKGFTLIMGIAAVITALIALYQSLTLKERYIVERKKDEKAPSFKEMFVAVFTNKTAVIVDVYLFATSLANGIRAGVSIHYFKYFFHNEAMMAVGGIIAFVPALIGVALSAKVTKRLGIKTIVMISVVFSVISMASVIVIPDTSIGLIIFFVIGTIGAFIGGMASPAQGTMMPAAMDYTEWKSGLNINAFMGSINGFIQTFATAVSGAIAAGALAFIGYIPGVEQSSSTIFGLKVLMSVLPAIFIAFTACIMWFDLTEEKQAQITRELAERRKNEEWDVTV
jgi:GPH family glycoside/pentoside/hexuronide:cation symporter/probable glucitol transport protein GutA